MTTTQATSLTSRETMSDGSVEIRLTLPAPIVERYGTYTIGLHEYDLAESIEEDLLARVEEEVSWQIDQQAMTEVGLKRAPRSTARRKQLWTRVTELRAECYDRYFPEEEGW